MEIRHYQNQTKRTAIYPGQNSLMGLLYCTIGLCDESGEVAGKVKKILRDQNGEITDETRETLTKELGDVLWYLSQLCYELNINMEIVALNNLAKLRKRQRDDTLHGSGDDR